MTEEHSKKMLDAEAKLKQVKEEKANLISSNTKEKLESEENLMAKFQQR